MLLARRGFDVLLVDRARFPSDIPHGHFIHRHGPRRLRDWGVLDKIAASTPAIDTMLFDAGDFPLLARNLIEDGLPWGYGPRRTTLDSILMEAAAASGAEVRPAFNVFEYIIENGTVVGIHGRTQDGSTVLERAPLVVGADGRNSGLARAVGAPVYNQVPAILCYYFSYWRSVAAEPFELYVRNEARRVVTRRRTVPVGDGWDAMVSAADPPDHPMLRSEREQALRVAFARLGEECRRLLALLVSEPPLSYDEIAAAVGRPRGSLGPTRRRCLEQLRRHLPGGTEAV